MKREMPQNYSKRTVSADISNGKSIIEIFLRFGKKFWQEIFELFFPKNHSEEVLENISPSRFKELAGHPQKEIEGVITLFSYKDSLVKNLIWLIKYKKRDFAINLAAQLLLDVTLEDTSEQMIFAGREKTLLIPIPISKSRLEERGYNQMEEIAQKIIDLGGNNCFEYENASIFKIKETKSQTSIKNKEERLKNVIDCFSVGDPAKIKGRNVLVIDDVATTGATLFEAKKVLEKAGALSISLLALAH